MNVLILSRYDTLGASSRLRMHQYGPSLVAAGAEVTVAPLFDDDYLRSLYHSQNWTLARAGKILSIAASYLRRLRVVANAKRFDVVWVEKELFPMMPGALESWLHRLHVPYVVDYDDAIFHSYDSSPSRWIRKALSNKLDGLLAVSYAVTVGNNYLAQYAHSHGARRVVLIPTVVDIDRYRVTPEPPGDVFRIAWIGSPGTTKYLQLLAEPLRRLALEKKIMLVTIGAGPLHLPGVPLEQHAWSLDNETQLLETIHVGVMPLPDSPWERGKCGYKLIQYMACGRPVVASPVGINKEIVTPEIGFLASDVQGWYEGLRALSDQPALRQRMGQAARDRVEQSYSLQVTAPKIVRLLADAADGAKPCVA